MPQGSSPEPITVLAVTADSRYADDAQAHLEQQGRFRVRTAETMEGALEQYHTAAPDCIISDYTLPEADGLALLSAVRMQDPELPFFMFAENGEDVVSRAIAAGVTDYFTAQEYRREWDTLGTLLSEAVMYYRSRPEQEPPEQRVRNVLDAAEETIAIARAGQCEFVNAAGVDLFGADEPTDLLGQQLEELLEAAPEEYLPPSAAQQPAEPTVQRSETRARSPDGTLTPVSVTATPAEWDGNRAVALVLRDLSERRQRSQELSLRERAMDDAPVGITVVEAGDDQPLVYVNEGFERLTGYDESEILGCNCRFLQGPDTAEEPVRQMWEAIVAEEPVTVELCNYRKDGTQFWNRVTITPLRNEAGQVTHYLGFQEDVTERKEAKTDLRRFKRAVEAAGHAIFITGTDGRIEYVNSAFEEITGYDRGAAIGAEASILQSKLLSEEFYQAVFASLDPGEVWADEVLNRRQSGALYHARQTIASITDEEGDIEAFVGIQTDITEQIERDQQLAVLDRMLRHNLRNDINIMMSHAEMIVEGIAEDPTEAANRIVEKGQQLVEMADKERNATSMLSEPAAADPQDIVAIAERTVLWLRERYPSAELSLSAPTGSQVVSVVPEIEQALIELIENAIKHSDSESPQVEIAVDPAAETVEIAVEDWAPPIPVEERDIISGEVEIDALSHSSGMGLWLVNWIVTRSGGTLAFESGDTRGNTVRLVLPRASEREGEGSAPDDGS